MVQSSTAAIVRWNQWCHPDSHLVFFAGHLDHRQQLIRTLGFNSDAQDAELVLAAYRKFGENCPQYLYGEFAFAICDPVKQAIFAARDALGCQPVYYHVDSERFVIAEDIAELLGVSGVSREPDECFIAATLSSYFAHPERTAFRHVLKIPPGHTLTVSANSKSLAEFWTPEDVPLSPVRNMDEAAEILRGLLVDAIRDRLATPSGIGVHVSGGLDCSAVAALVSRELRSDHQPPPQAFSWYPPPDKGLSAEARSEYDRVQSVCDQENLRPVYCGVQPDHVLDVLKRDHCERPICNATYAEWVVQKEAEQRGVTTIMSGFGGDEAASFNGRGYLAHLALRGHWRRLRRIATATNQPSWRFCARHLKHGIEQALYPNWLLDLTLSGRGLDLPLWKSISCSTLRRMGLSADYVLSPEQRTSFRETQPYLHEDFHDYVRSLSCMPRIRSSSVHNTQCQLLRWGHLSHRMESWAADGRLRGIRYTYPLLDRRVVEFALGLPDDVFENGRCDRSLFRTAMKSVLPPGVCWAQSKSDPARATPQRNAMLQAFEEIGRQLRCAKITSPKQSYLDMPRLIQDLDSNALRHRTRIGRLVYAVEFLGTESLS